MKSAVLVIIKPEGILRNIVGKILSKFAEIGLEIEAMRLTRVSRALATEHYKHLKGKPFFNGVIDHLMGKYHKNAKVLAFVLCGHDAIQKCRRIAGSTSPEEASPSSIRGTFGRITSDGIFENVVHVSSDETEAKREIRLWFQPDRMRVAVFPSKTAKQKMKKRAKK